MAYKDQAEGPLPVALLFRSESILVGYRFSIYGCQLILPEL